MQKHFIEKHCRIERMFFKNFYIFTVENIVDLSNGVAAVWQMR